VLEPVGWDGEYRTDLPWPEVRRLRAAAQGKDARALFGVGSAAGSLAIFGVAQAFDPVTGHPSTYELLSLARIPLAGSNALRRLVPAGAGRRFAGWDLVDVEPWTLCATQDSVRSDALGHYMTDAYRRMGALFDTASGSANDDPVVLEVDGRRLVLTGHHRTVAALLRGLNLTVRYARA
jgi:hypothetical protein